jgi:HEAT repeat protein
MSREEGTTEAEPSAGVETLIAELRDNNGLKREDARRALQKLGKSATPYLIKALFDEDKHARWEAAKALKVVRDPKAGPALTCALMDKKFEVQWLAAEALIGLKRDALAPLFQALVSKHDSVSLRHGAHHILHALEDKRLLDERSHAVLEELRNMDPAGDIVIAARKALEAWGAKP